MTPSWHHRNFRDFAAHYLSPLHLMGPVIKIALKTNRRPLRRTLWSFVAVYDRLYRVIFAR